VSAPPIRIILEGAGTGLPALLLGSGPRRRFIGHLCEPKNNVSPKSTLKMLSEPSVEML
jgi:hypothetical protein